MDTMLETLLALFLAFWGALIAHTAARIAWFHFRWRVLGYAPVLHDEDLVRSTAETCARGAVAARRRAPGAEPDGEQTEERIAELADTYKLVIGKYVEDFTLKL